ncbi:unnamed protein product [Dovyalis caffra]|uniref:ribonuclease Z n=1 Tax=Dovyalis caffra TaxID=77055 RepID=A0AAV1QX48_9ROSI|nr:unnamed protein product [Dovyalis caffra]
MENVSKTFKFNQSRAKGSYNSHEPKKNKLRQNNGHGDVVNTTAYVQILGTGMDTHDTLPSVLLFFDNQRFIFNVGEGLQRFCAEHKIKLSKIDYVCLSRACSETAGGLPGLLLTLAGMGEGMSVNIWGPSDLKLLVEAMKSFIPHAAMVHTKLISDDRHVLVDNNAVKVSAILLRPHILDGSHVKPCEISVIYVCELHEIRGKFNKEKADAFGLTVREKYRILQRGDSVHPSDVFGPSIPGPIVFIVDCPTESHAQELLFMESLNGYYSDFSDSSPQSTKVVNCIIHLTPASVVSSPSYEKWMQKFDSAQHIRAGHALKNVEIPILKSSARVAARLNYLCPQLFPTPTFLSLRDRNNAAQPSAASSEGPVSKLSQSIFAENLLKFNLRPHARLGLDKSNVPSLIAPTDVISELLLEIPEIVDAAQHVSEFWKEPSETKEDTTVTQDSKVGFEDRSFDGNYAFPSCLENIQRDDLEVVFLGTGSSQPSKYRNVSSIYINLFSKGSLLLDCGEGTLAQLKRRYGKEGADNAVRNLRCVWISHIHADHHAGLVRILTLRQDLLRGVLHEPILVIGPMQLKRFLDEYQRLEDLHMQFLDCRDTVVASWNAFEGDTADINHRTTNNPGLSSSAEESFLKHCSKRPKLSESVDNGVAFLLLKSLKKILREAGLDRLISFPVVHCPEAFGVVLKAAERNNSAGEATFEDGMVGEAIARNHSTTKEAIEVGDSADAYRIILTHFSQRYPKIPSLDEISIQKTCIAFDLMSINVADLPMLPNVLPYLKLLFKKEMTTDTSDDAINATP